MMASANNIPAINFVLQQLIITAGSISSPLVLSIHNHRVPAYILRRLHRIASKIESVCAI